AWGTCSGQLPQLRLRLLQPVRHPHLAVHRRRGGEVLLRLLALARASVELAEAEVAVGDDETHPTRFGEVEPPAIVVGGVVKHGGIGLGNVAQKQTYPCRLADLLMLPGEFKRG